MERKTEQEQFAEHDSKSLDKFIWKKRCENCGNRWRTIGYPNREQLRLEYYLLSEETPGDQRTRKEVREIEKH